MAHMIALDIRRSASNLKRVSLMIGLQKSKREDYSNAKLSSSRHLQSPYNLLG